MKKALFVVANAQGHLNGSLKISIPLQQKGYDIFYTTNPRYADWVLDNNFKYKPSSLNRKRVSETNYLDQNILKTALIYFLDRLTNIHYDYRICQLYELKELNKLIQPDIIFIDSFLTDYQVAFESSSCKCIQMETMVLTEKSPGIPPLNTLILPTFSTFNKLNISFLWKKKFFKSYVSSFLSRIITFNQDAKSIWAYSVRYFNISNESASSKKNLFHRRIEKIPCVVTSPRYFDFPRKIPNGVYYTNNFVRQDLKKSDNKSFSIKHVIKSVKSRNQNQKIIYCSLGTLAISHSKNSNEIFYKILDVFKELDEFQLILSLGKNIDKSSIEVPVNVHVFDYVNQLEVLNYVDMMITHGGMNTISECIFAEVPMLVFPLNSKWDQNGNASRINYHKIGLNGSIMSDSKEEVIGKIKSVIWNSEFKYNIKNLKNKILNDEKSICFFKFLERFSSNIS